TRVRTGIEWQQVASLANVGGFGGRANRLNHFNVFARNPGLINTDIQRFLAVSAEDVSRVARKYLGGDHVRLEVLPEPSRTSSVVGTIDRSVQPAASAERRFTPPATQRRTLANGLNLLVAEKHGLPIVAFSLVVKAGAVHDPASLPGAAAFTTAMLEEGTQSRSSQQISEEFESLGTDLNSMAGRERAALSVHALKRQWPKALELVGDLVRHATFPQEEVDRIRRERLTSLRRVKDDPTTIAGRLAPALIYGSKSGYGHPLNGTEEAVEALHRDQMLALYRTRFRPDFATLVVAGDVTMDEVAELAEGHVGGWSAGGSDESGGPPIERFDRNEEETLLYVVDKPGAAQSVLRVGHIGVARHHPDYYALTIFNQLFGGQFMARLNINLRENKGYSYGYRSWFEWHTESSLFLAGGGVQTAVTREAVAETLRELDEVRTSRPVERAEFEEAKLSSLRQFPSSFETPSHIQDHLNQIVAYDLPDDYYQTLMATLDAVTLEDVRRVVVERIRGLEGLTLLVVGDREVIEPGLRELGLPMRFVDHEGSNV
ncbi:MAG: pitrilysin family protein, partial [Chloroflexi bacterium]|nr:pitrilysin family protein [Chloroflexota bacterium]